MPKINVLWIIDHVCYDGSLHGGGRLYWSSVPRFDTQKIHIVPCFLRASDAVRDVFSKSPVPINILNKGKFDLSTLGAIINLIKKEKIQVMHLHCYAASTFGRIISLFTGIPAIIHDYDTQVYFPYPWYLDILDRILSPVTAGAVAASPMVRDYMIKVRKICPDRIRMLFHAIPEDKYKQIPQERISKIKDTLKISPNTKIIGTITKLGPKRGNEYLLQSACEVLKEFPNALFLIVYKPTYYHRIPKKLKGIKDIHNTAAMKAELEELVKKLNIEKNVLLIESLDKPDELISVCDLIVAPFLDDRFSSVNLLEAMAMGKPVIATDMGEQKEVIKNGFNGYLVKPADVKELAGKITNLLSSPEELHSMSLQAKDEAARYSVGAYVKTLERWYEELAERKS